MTGPTNQQVLAFQAAMMFQAMAMTFVAAATQQNVGYQATPEGAAKCRQAFGAAGLSVVPGPRVQKLSARERANAECKANARKLGYAV